MRNSKAKNAKREKNNIINLRWLMTAYTILLLIASSHQQVPLQIPDVVAPMAKIAVFSNPSIYKGVFVVSADTSNSNQAHVDFYDTDFCPKMDLCQGATRRFTLNDQNGDRLQLLPQRAYFVLMRKRYNKLEIICQVTGTESILRWEYDLATLPSSIDAEEITKSNSNTLNEVIEYNDFNNVGYSTLKPELSYFWAMSNEGSSNNPGSLLYFYDANDNPKLLVLNNESSNIRNKANFKIAKDIIVRVYYDVSGTVTRFKLADLDGVHSSSFPTNDVDYPSPTYQITSFAPLTDSYALINLQDGGGYEARGIFYDSTVGIGFASFTPAVHSIPGITAHKIKNIPTLWNHYFMFYERGPDFCFGVFRMNRDANGIRSGFHDSPLNEICLPPSTFGDVTEFFYDPEHRSLIIIDPTTPSVEVLQLDSFEIQDWFCFEGCSSCPKFNYCEACGDPTKIKYISSEEVKACITTEECIGEDVKLDADGNCVDNTVIEVEESYFSKKNLEVIFEFNVDVEGRDLKEKTSVVVVEIVGDQKEFYEIPNPKVSLSKKNPRKLHVEVPMDVPVVQSRENLIVDVRFEDPAALFDSSNTNDKKVNKKTSYVHEPVDIPGIDSPLLIPAVTTAIKSTLGLFTGLSLLISPTFGVFMIKLPQFYDFLGFMSIELPLNLAVFLELFDLSVIEMMGNVMIALLKLVWYNMGKWFDNEDVGLFEFKNNTFPNSKIEERDFVTSIFGNSGTFLVVMILLLIIKGIFYLLSRLIEGSKILKWINEKLFGFTFWTNLMIGLQIDLLSSVFVNLMTIRFTNFFFSLSSLLSLSFLALYGCLVTAILFNLYKTYSGKKLENKWKFILEDVKEKITKGGSIKLFFVGVVLIRDTVYPLLMIIFIKIKFIQVPFLFVFQLAMAGLSIAWRPFDSVLDTVATISLEVTSSLILLFLTILWGIEDKWTEKAKNDIIGTPIILVVLANLVITLVICVLHLISSIKEIWKKFKNRSKKNIQVKPIPSTMNSSKIKPKKEDEEASANKKLAKNKDEETNGKTILTKNKDKETNRKTILTKNKVNNEKDKLIDPKAQRNEPSQDIMIMSLEEGKKKI